MQFETVADSRKQVFVGIRYILILSLGALVFTEGTSTSPWIIALLVLAALASNVILGGLPSKRFFSSSVQAPLLIGDTAMVSIMLLFTHAGGECFLLFFLVLIMAAKVDNPITLGLGGAAVGIASLFPHGATDTLPALMRVPFFFAASIFFGYVALPERLGDVRHRVEKARRATALSVTPRGSMVGTNTASAPDGMLQVDYTTRLHARKLR